MMTGKKNGGIGIKNKQIQSKAPRIKWLRKYSNNNQMLWRKVIGVKYDEEKS